MSRIRKSRVIATMSAFAAAGAASVLLAQACQAASAPAPRRFQRVVTIVLENTDADQAIKQPFLGKLAREGALLADFEAIAHPSQPNYVAMISGDTQGILDDDSEDIDARNIADLLEAKGLSWKAYAEDYPGHCFKGDQSATYVRKHEPFISFKDIQDNPSRCARIVDAGQLAKDVAAGTLPTYSFYSPGLDDDGHDTDVQYADHWLETTFGPMLADPRLTRGTLFVFTFDESETYLGNHIYTVLWGAGVKPGAISNLPYDHYSVLRTIEDELGLGTLGENDGSASPINDIWK